MVEPVYPLTEGLTLNPVRKAAEAALGENPDAAGMAGCRLAAAAEFPAFAGALQTLHRPADPADIAAGRHGLVAARL